VGADAFHVCYDVRREVDAADAANVEALELRRHPWQVAARRPRDRVIRTHPPAVAARKIKRTLYAVYSRRSRLCRLDANN